MSKQLFSGHILVLLEYGYRGFIAFSLHSKTTSSVPSIIKSFISTLAKVPKLFEFVG
jgi:hypothetical protein